MFEKEDDRFHIHYFRLVTKNPAVEVKKSNSLSAYECTFPVHQFLHLALKFPITIEQNGDVSSIFDNVKWKFWQ